MAIECPQAVKASLPLTRLSSTRERGAFVSLHPWDNVGRLDICDMAAHTDLKIGAMYCGKLARFVQIDFVLPSMFAQHGDQVRPVHK
jgi:hypothetical protein